MRSEFQFIKHVKETYALKKVGDDCAVLGIGGENDLVITSDLLVEDIDFRLEWSTPESLGHKVLAVSLSDIAAMGAEAKWALVSIGIPENLWNSDFLDGFYEGWHQLAGKFGVELIGGDISRSPDKLFVDSTVIGCVSPGRAILRSGAKAGDAIFVTGRLGGAACGLKLLNKGVRVASDDSNVRKLIERQLKPFPQLRVAKYLWELDLVNSMIDVSDGLAADLFHLCEASEVGALLMQDSIPIDPLIFGITDKDSASAAALYGGEDYELLFTVPSARSADLQEFPATPIGYITENAGEFLISANGTISNLEPKGFQHFQRG